MSYDKYIILASNSKVLSGDYTGFVNFREVVEVAEDISTKQIDTYLYNGEHYTLPIKLSELSHILNAIDTGKINNHFDKVKKLSQQMGIRKI